jgi:hypothetical protein
MENILFLILILLGSGIFGGIVSYFRNDYDKTFEFKAIIKPILIGTAASLLVPLFLNMISSNLLEKSKTDNYAYFIILGFGLIASIFSSDFISALGKKILNELKDVKKEVENSNTEDEIVLPKATLKRNLQINPDEASILQAFKNSNYTYRSITGLAKQIGSDKAVVKGILSNLVSDDLIEVVQRSKGPRWKMTSSGYNYVAGIVKDEPTVPTRPQ